MGKGDNSDLYSYVTQSTRTISTRTISTLNLVNIQHPPTLNVIVARILNKTFKKNASTLNLKLCRIVMHWILEQHCMEQDYHYQDYHLICIIDQYLPEHLLSSISI